MLRSLRARRGRWLALQSILQGIALAALVGFGAVLLDAAVDLPENMRRGLPWLLALGLVLGLIGAVWGWRRFTEDRLAREFERANPGLGNRLINAVQLARDPGQTAVEALLRQEAIELGRKAAAGVAVWPSVRRAIRLSGTFAGAGFFAWLLLLLFGAPVWRAVLPRFVDPTGDHPPYSRVRFEVEPGRAEVLYAGQVEVRVRSAGPPVDKLWLVARSGTNQTRALMFLAPDRSFFQTLVNLRDPGEYYVTDGRGRSYRFPIGIRYTPQITLAEVHFSFPEYTARPEFNGKLPEEPQALPEGTRIQFRVASNRPLKHGSLKLTPVLGGKPTEIGLTPGSQPTMVTGEMTLSQPVAFALSVTDIQGLACAEPRQGRFNILPDERPRLFVLEPGRDAVATPAIKIPVRLEARDDYGIARVYWLRGHNRSVERPFSLKLQLRPGPQAVTADGAFDLAQLGVRPGDVIEYYFEAADNYPKGPNLALSKMYRLDIISPEQYEELLRQAAAQQALFEPYFKLDRWLQRLAERARTSAESARTNETSAPQLARDLEQELADYLEELSKLLETSTLFDIEESFRAVLGSQQQQLQAGHKRLKQASGKDGGASREELEQLAKELAEMARRESEQVGEPARELATVSAILAQADFFVKLAQEQAELAKLLRRFDKTGPLTRLEEMELQELAGRQRRVEEGLQRMMTQLPALLEQLPEDPAYDKLRQQVEDFVAEVEHVKIPPDLDEAANRLANAEGKPGYEVARRAAEKMDALISRCNGQIPQDGQQCLSFRPSISQGLGNSLQQILQAMGAQSSGQGMRDGYSMFNNQVSIYGPGAATLVGQQAGGRGDIGRPGGAGRQTITGDSRDPDLATKPAVGRVRLQPDAKFPLRYRDLVGEYFRAIAETQDQQEPKR